MADMVAEIEGSEEDGKENWSLKSGRWAKKQ